MGRRKLTALDWAHKDWQDARRRAHYDDDAPEVVAAKRKYELECRKRSGHTGDFYRGKGYRRRRRKAEALEWPYIDDGDGWDLLERGEVSGILTKFGFHGGVETRKSRTHFHDVYLVKGWLCQMKRYEPREQGEWLTTFIAIDEATISNRYEIDGCDEVTGHVKDGFLDRIEVRSGDATTVITNADGDAIVRAAIDLGLFLTDEELDEAWAA